MGDRKSEPKWLWSGFEQIEPHIRKQLLLDRSLLQLNDSAVYELQKGFIEEDRYWVQNLRSQRMKRASPVLYRPHIVKDLVENVERLLNEGNQTGLMVKGPQGVGKSYSLVNLARHLMATGRYHVTFIPDCEKFQSAADLYSSLLDSVGVDAYQLKIDFDNETKVCLSWLLMDIVLVLVDCGKRWVFIFDPINRLFARDRDAQNIGTLRFPFNMI